jgi:hypothetical protein
MSSIPLITVVANYFGNKNSATELKFSTLYNIKNAVESHFLKTENAFVYVNISWDEISYIIENYPNYFSYNENYTSIIFKPSDEFYEDLFGVFNTIHNLDESTNRHKILDFLENFIENDLVE